MGPLSTLLNLIGTVINILTLIPNIVPGVCWLDEALGLNLMPPTLCD